MALSPTFLMASRPKRMASPSTVKSTWLWRTSGPSTSMPRRRHSAMAPATFSVLSRKAERTLVMYSTG